MNEWAFLLTPLLVLPIVLLFRFVGCTSFGAEEPPPPAAPKKPGYAKYIMADPNNPGSVKNNTVVPSRADVIGYWRLVDKAGSTTAKDEKGFQNGLYKEPSSLVPGQPGLIASDPSTGFFFNGGYVIVPFKAGLYTDEFTIEAWVKRTGQQPGVEHTLFSAGGRYTAPFEETPSFHLLSLVINKDNRWQVRLGPSALEVFPNPGAGIVPLNVSTHVAVTVAKDSSAVGQSEVILYIDSKVAGTERTGFYARPDGAPLFIGISPASSDPGADPSNPPALHQPILAGIQEVTLHNKALTQDEIENHVDLGT
jgi:hypothetical protein